MSDPAGPPVMFRAGGPASAAAAPGIAPAFAGPVTYLCDASEFQSDIHDAVYLAWSRAIIIRACYGSQHDDRAWYGGQRRDLLHAGGAAFVGIYGYLVAGQDAAVQAHALVNLVGHLRQGEKLICDIEEGPFREQATRWRQWSAVITAAYGPRADPWLYAGESFAASAGLSPHWVAAYRNTEPGGSHLLWQFTDRYPVPGVGICDASMFRGTIGQLAAHGWQAPVIAPQKPPPVKVPAKPAPAPAPKPVPPGWQEAMMAKLPVLALGSTGPHVRTLQALCTARGYPAVIDGTFGPATKGSLMAVQRHYGLTPDGVAGSLTWPALFGV